MKKTKAQEERQTKKEFVVRKQKKNQTIRYNIIYVYFIVLLLFYKYF